jgi:sec-independent protein translocase protein TatA
MELLGSGGIILLIIIAVLFGAKKLPEVARSVGRAQGEFKKGLKEGAVEDPPEQKTDGSVSEPPAQTG